jgi:hypothetical protein
MSEPQEYFVTVTQSGLALEGITHGNQQALRLLNMGVGDGLTPEAIAAGALYFDEYRPDGSETALRNERWSGPITKVAPHPSNPGWWIAEAALPDEVGGWFVSEVALYAEDGSLYAIAKYPPSLKPAWSTGAGRQIYVRLVFQLTAAAEVTVVVDPAVVYVSREYVDTAIEELELRTLATMQAGQSGQVPVRSSTPGPGNPIEWVAPGKLAGAAVRKTVAFVAAAGARYYLANTLVATLPKGSTLQPGDSIAFIKARGAEPLIQADGDTITTTIGADNAVTYNINAEIFFVWSGLTWEL